MTTRVAAKLEAIRANPSGRTFILADARDADMAWGVPSPGTVTAPGGATRHRTMPEFRDQIRAVVAQGEIDLLLASSSTMALLAHQERLFDRSTVTPAVRMNDSTDIWTARGGRYASHASHPFASTTFNEAMYGTETPAEGQAPLVTLGLYSVTFNNDLSTDLRTLEAFRAFRLEAQRRRFSYFLEVFAPNVAAGLTPSQIGPYVNDQIARMLAGVPQAGRPAFLKIPFLGPDSLEELVAYDPSVIVGILGGNSGTTFETFTLLQDAQRHGARVALFGRRIKDAEDPLALISCMRRVVDGHLPLTEAVRAYHDQLRQKGIPPRRSLEEDLKKSPPA